MGFAVLFLFPRAPVGECVFSEGRVLCISDPSFDIEHFERRGPGGQVLRELGPD